MSQLLPTRPPTRVTSPRHQLDSPAISLKCRPSVKVGAQPPVNERNATPTSTSASTTSTKDAAGAKRRPGGGPNGGPPPDPDNTPDFGDLAGSAFLAAGFSGSLAVGGAALTHVNLFSQFHPTQASLTQALLLAAPLLILDILTLGLEWGWDWQAAAPGPIGGVSVGVSSSAAGKAASGQDSPAAVAAAAVAAAAAASKGKDDSVLASWSLFTLRTSLALYQVATLGDPTAPVPVVASSDDGKAGTATDSVSELALVGVRELGKELLQRGLAFTLIATWLRDRLLEGGLEDGFLLLPGLPGLAGLLRLSPTDGGRFGAALLILSLLVPAAGAAAEASRLSVATRLAMARARGPGPVDEAAAAADMLLQFRVLADTDKCAELVPARFAESLASWRFSYRAFALNAAFCFQGDLAATLGVSLLLDGLLLAARDRRRATAPAP